MLGGPPSRARYNGDCTRACWILEQRGRELGWRGMTSAARMKKVGRRCWTRGRRRGPRRGKRKERGGSASGDKRRGATTPTTRKRSEGAAMSGTRKGEDGRRWAQQGKEERDVGSTARKGEGWRPSLEQSRKGEMTLATRKEEVS